MDIFLEVKNKRINISKIKEIGIERNDTLRVVFDDGSSGIYCAPGDAKRVVEKLEKTIIQISPCPTPMYNVYSNGDGSYIHERVCCLALCADGEVRSLAGCEWFDLAEEARNFVGCFDGESLNDYPQDTNCEVGK